MCVCVFFFAAQMQDLFVLFFFFAVGSSCSDRKCCDRAGESGWCVFAFFYMGLNHYIDSLLNYRLLFFSQRHHAIFEALLCLRAWFCLLFFFFFSYQMCLFWSVSVYDIFSPNHLTLSAFLSRHVVSFATLHHAEAKTFLWQCLHFVWVRHCSFYYVYLCYCCFPLRWALLYQPRNNLSLLVCFTLEGWMSFVFSLFQSHMNSHTHCS